MPAHEIDHQPHPYSVDARRRLFLLLSSRRPNAYLCNGWYPGAAIGLLKTHVFLLLGLLLHPSGAPLAALGSLLWLIGAPYRVHGCFKQVCFCYGGPWACHWDLYWPIVLTISSPTGLRLMLLGLGIVMSTMQCLFGTSGSRVLRWFSDSFTPGLTL